MEFPPPQEAEAGWLGIGVRFCYTDLSQDKPQPLLFPSARTCRGGTTPKVPFQNLGSRDWVHARNPKWWYISFLSPYTYFQVLRKKKTQQTNSRKSQIEVYGDKSSLWSKTISACLFSLVLTDGKGVCTLAVPQTGRQNQVSAEFFNGAQSPWLGSISFIWFCNVSRPFFFFRLYQIPALRSSSGIKDI